MACKINNTQLKELFFKGLSYNYDRYRNYRSVIDRFLAMETLDDESKVYSIWFMGLLYNKALEMDSNIITEGLPLKISRVVKNKIFDKTADFKSLFKEVRDILQAPVTEAELEGVGPTAPTDIKAKKALGQELISIVWARLSRQGVTNADSIVGTRETIDNVDFDKFWSNVTKEDLQNLKKQYETKKKEQLDLYDKFKGEFDPSTGTITSDDTSFFDNKIKDIDAELATLSQPAAPALAPASAPVIKSFSEQINDLFKQVGKSKNASVLDLYDQFKNLVDTRPSITDSNRLALYKKFAEAAGKMPTSSLKSALIARVNVDIDTISKPITTPSAYIDIGEDQRLGKDFYIITKANGDIIEAVYNPADNSYYEYQPGFDGTDFTSLTPVEYTDKDHIRPIYRIKENLSETNPSGEFNRFYLDFINNGFRPYGLVRNPNKDTRTSIQIIADNIPRGSNLISQIRMVADRREHNLFAERLRRIQETYPEITEENQLRQSQIEQLRKNPNKPVVGLINPIGGIQLKIYDLAGENFDFLETFDQLRFIYSNNRTRRIDWNNPEDVKLFQDSVQVKKGRNYVAPTVEDVANLVDTLAKISSIKLDIAEMMGDDLTYEVPTDIVRNYFTISNTLSNWKFGKLGVPVKSLEDLSGELTTIGSTVTAYVAPREMGDKLGIPRTIEVVPVIRRTNRNTLIFEDTIPKNMRLINAAGQPISLNELFEDAGINLSDINLDNFKGPTFFYLWRNSEGKWAPRAMKKSGPMTDDMEIVDFMFSLSALKDLMPPNTQENRQERLRLIQHYNNNGWGFNYYKGIIADVQFLETKEDPKTGLDDVYGIRFRADNGYPPDLAKGFNNRGIQIQFPFDLRDLRSSFNTIVTALGKNVGDYATVEKRLVLANEIARELRENNDALSPEVKAAVTKIADVYKSSLPSIYKQATEHLLAHQQDVKDGEQKYIDNEKSFLTLLFTNTDTGTVFNLRSNFKGNNPLSMYKVFERSVNENSEKKIVIKLASGPTISDPGIARVPTPTEAVKPEPPQTNAPSGKVVPKVLRKRTLSVVDSLEGIQQLASPEFAQEIETVKRFMGTTTPPGRVKRTDLSGEDAEGIVLGKLEGQVIKLDKNIRAKGVAYHEAFHAIFRFSLTGPERSKYYSAVKEITGGVQQDEQGKYILSRGKKVYLDQFREKRRLYGIPDDTIENLIYEEHLADGFKDFVIDKVEPKNALIRLLYNALEKLVNIFKSKQYKALKEVRNLYEGIYEGRYADVLSTDPYEGPVAYELYDIPKYLKTDQNGELQIIPTPLDATSTNQVRDMLVKKLAEKGKFAEDDFNQMYDSVTNDLISYYNVDNFITPENQANAEAIKLTYGPLFNAYRFLMGYAHRFKGGIILENRSGDPTYDNTPYEDDEYSIEVFEKMREEVKKDYYNISIIDQEVNTTDTEDAEQRETGTEADEETDDVNQKGEEEIGEDKYDDGGIITLKPYEGSSEFKRLIRYIEYEFTDPALGVSFKRMVNSKEVINIIRKVVANKPTESILSTLQDRIEYMNSNIDAFFSSPVYTDLGEIPTDMLRTIEERDTLKSVYDTFTQNAGLDEDGNITIQAGGPMLKMFHKVFEQAQVEIVSQVITTEQVKDQTTNQLSVKNTIRNENIVKNTAVNNALSRVDNTLKSVLNNISDKVIERASKVRTEIVQNTLPSYILPKDFNSFNYTVDQLYRMSSLIGLNMSRPMIEFSVAADMYRKNKENRSIEYVADIVNADIDLYQSREYLNPSKFYDAVKGLAASIENGNLKSFDTHQKNLLANYRKAAPYDIKYDPTFISTTVRNSEGKAITAFIPFTPSLVISRSIQENGVRATIERYHPDKIAWFESNQWIGPTMGEAEIDPQPINKLKNFMAIMKVSVAGGVRQNYGRRNTQSTFRRLGDKSYMLSALGMFMDKQVYFDDYDQPFQTFNRAITQFESTGTQFNVTALYEDFKVKGAKKRITELFKGIIQQEYLRIMQEWATRNDYKSREEGYNAITTADRTVDTESSRLRAYQFNILKDFFAFNEDTRLIGESLIAAAKRGETFEEALQQIPGVDQPRIDLALAKELPAYGDRTFQSFKDYLREIGLIGTSEDIEEVYKNIPGAVKNISGSYENITGQQKEKLLEDFMYNYLFNSMYFNQLFDGDIAVGVSSLVKYFKRQKSGVAAGPNNRNYEISLDQDNTTFATIRTPNNDAGIKGYVNPTDPYEATTTSPIGTEARDIADGQGYVTIDRRIKKFDKNGLIDAKLLALLKKMRYTALSNKEREQLVDGGIILNSDKPVIADPTYYLKDSEHLLMRSDYSNLKKGADIREVEELYRQLDSIDFDNNTVENNPEQQYRDIMKQIHGYFEPKPERALLHHILNAMEFYRVDVLSDETVTKKGSPAPLVIDIAALEQNVMDTTAVMTVPGKQDGVLVFEDGYINLSYSKRSVPNELVYEQVKTSKISEVSTDSIQKNLLVTAGMDPADKKFAPIKEDLTQIRKLRNEMARSRMQYLQRLFGATEPNVFITKMIQQGMVNQGASTNLLKFFSIDRETGKNKFNLNLPMLGKTPLYYFFSLFNKNVFSPKVPGKKYYHVSPLGYKIKDKVTGEIRYPKVYERDAVVNGKTIKQTVVEVIIPREIAETREEREFFEVLYSEFLATRIPTEGIRSMLVAKVVDTIDGSYGNSIIVPAQIHRFAGSDLDIDALYTEMPAYYRNARGTLIKYGDYSSYLAMGMSEEDAKFLEYLHFVADDPGFEEQIDGEKRRLSNEIDYKKRSLKNGAKLFSPKIQEFFELSEQESGVKKVATGKGLDSLAQLVMGEKAGLTKKQKNTVKIIDRLIPVINVLKSYASEKPEFRIPSTPKELAAFTKNKEYGNPVTPVLYNKLIEHNRNVLAWTNTFDTYVKDFSADAAISPYLMDADLLENVAGTVKLKQSNPFTFETVARIRSLNKDAKNMLNAVANLNKAIAVMSTSQVKLTPKYTFKFKYKDQDINTNIISPDASRLVGGSIGMAADDGQNQVAGVLKLNIATGAIMDAMYAFGYPEQFARLIHSVGIIGESINEYNNDNDSTFQEPGQRRYSFNTFLRNKVNGYLFNYREELLKLGLISPVGDALDTFELNEDAFTITFNDVTEKPPSPKAIGPDWFEMSVLDVNGKPVPNTEENPLAEIVLLAFYDRMARIGSEMSFKIATITSVLKSINPSFNNLTRINDAYTSLFVEKNEVFDKESLMKILKDYPVLQTLVGEVVPSMTEMSKDVLLDQTNLFKAVVGMFKPVFGLSQDDVVAELKSVLAMSGVRARIKDQADKIREKTDEVEVVVDEETGEKITYLRPKQGKFITPQEEVVLAMEKAMTLEYWTNNTIENDLNYLRNAEPDNEFIKSLKLVPAQNNQRSEDAKIFVVESIVGNKLEPKDREFIIDEFLRLVYHEDPMIGQLAINVAVHGIVKDGALSRKNGFLKIIAPGLFEPISEELDLIQDGFTKADEAGKRSLEGYLKQIDAVFSNIYRTKTTGDKAMQAILAKMISIFARDAGPDYRLRMSFFKPTKGKKRVGEVVYTPGKFSAISNNNLKTIIDSILPKNKQNIYKMNESGQMVSNHLLSNTPAFGSKQSSTSYEFWKADDNSELFWDLGNIPGSVLAESEVLLKEQGIIRTADGNYSFPLYKVNNYANGQVFLLTEIDGKPFTQGLFNNLFKTYKEDGEFQYLLRGRTAKYKIIRQQGTDKILPNSFTQATGEALRMEVLGEQTITSKKVKTLRGNILPSSVVIPEGSHSAVTYDENDAHILQSKTVVMNGVKMDFTSKVHTYTTKSSKYYRGQIFHNGKPLKDMQMYDRFARRMGYINYGAFASDPNNKGFLEPKKDTNLYAVDFTATKVGTSVVEFGQAPSKPVPVVETPTLVEEPTAPVAPIAQTGEQIYNQLVVQTGNKTKTPNIIIDDVAGRKASTQRGIVAYRTRGNDFLEAFEKDRTIGNPWNERGYGLYKSNSIKDAVIQFTNWLTGEAHTDKLQDYRKAIIDNLNNLRGRKIIYYRELNEPSHATALDYLINKYDWSKSTAPAALATPTAPTQPTATGFQGYKFGFEDKGKGTVLGDGKDKAMRKLADGFIGELASEAELPKKSPYDLRSIDTKTSTGFSFKTIGVRDGYSQDYYHKGPTVSSGKLVTTDDMAKVVMLARNGELKGKPLAATTKESILNAHEDGAEFVVGDMPGVDSQFIDYLQEIGAKFTVYHTDNKKYWTDKNQPENIGKPRIKISKPTTPTQPQAPVSTQPTVTNEMTSILSALGEKNVNNIISRYKSIEGLDDILIADVSSYDDKDGYQDNTGLSYQTLMDYVNFNVPTDNPIELDYPSEQYYVDISLSELLDRLTPLIAEVRPTLVYKGLQEIQFPEEVTPAAPAIQEKTITYTPVGKERQTYTIRGNKIFNKAGKEVFKEDSVDRNKIFANLAVQEGRAVIVEHKGAKYIVNNRQQIISGTTGKIMQWGEENGDRRAILAKANETRVTPTQAPRGVQVKEGIYVNQGALTREEQLALFNYLKPYLEKQAAKTNKAAAASKMIGLGLRWDYKSNNPGRSTVDIPNIIDPKSKAKYGYYTVSINGQRLGKITPEFRQLIEKASGVDMSDYDGAIINLYEANSFISSHNDVDESSTAINYPVVGINLGGKGNFSIESRDGNPMQLDLQSGTAYVFGVGGVNRRVYHRTFPSPQDSFLPELTTEIDGKTYPAGSYRVTITMRRVMPLEPGMPTAPKMSPSQPIDPSKDDNPFCS